MARKVFKWVSPQGIAEYPYLATPDTKFGNDYKVTLKVPKEEAEETKKQLNEFLKKAKGYLESQDKNCTKNNLNSPYKELEDGSLEISTKQAAIITPKRGAHKGKPIEMTVGTYNAKLKPIDPREIRTGDLIKVEVELAPYHVSGKWGISKRLRNVQLLKSNGSPMGGSTGFQVEEQYVDDTSEDSYDMDTDLNSVGEPGEDEELDF